MMVEHKKDLVTFHKVGNPMFARLFFSSRFLVGRLVISKFHGFIEK